MLRGTLYSFPAKGRVEATNKHGVYVMYNAEGEVVHVGKTNRRKNGLKQRLTNHLYDSTSKPNYLSGYGVNQRSGYRFLLVPNERHRTLLEAFAIGTLCPRHI